jgi:ribosome-binding protein aMBF1 (putative translation factor)
MILNARQYRITKAQAAKFAQALRDFDARPAKHPGVHPKLVKAQRDALRSQLVSLQAELKEYERTRTSRRRFLDPTQIAELPQALIRARIAARLSQRELAECLGLKEQQIQRYEATQYASASLSRIIEIVNALSSPKSKAA